MLCPYCGREAELVEGDVIYPFRQDLWDKKYWSCVPCGAYVGCHPGTDKPLGCIADKELRRLRVEAHERFDRLWRNGGPLTRTRAYQWLAFTMELGAKQAHIGKFDKGQCIRLKAALKSESWKSWARAACRQRQI